MRTSSLSKVGEYFRRVVFVLKEETEERGLGSSGFDTASSWLELLFDCMLVVCALFLHQTLEANPG